MVKIRLQRKGAKNNPFYRIVVTDEKKKLSGASLELLGQYDPKSKKLVINKKRVDFWVERGAQVSDALKKLMAK